MEPWMSWALAVGLGGGAVWYYTTFDRNGRVKKAAARTVDAVVEQIPGTASASKRRQEKPLSTSSSSSSSRQRESATGDNDSSAKKRKQPKPTSQAPSVQALRQVHQQDDDEAEALDDSSWAQQLQANKAGVSLAASAAQQQKSKTVRANASNSMPSSKDVSDMLEPAPAAPTVLRVTGEAKENKPKPSGATAADQKESKKQRQRRKKREEEQALAAANEKERQAQLESQRRTAREARGEPAKNGLGGTQTAPDSNAWSTVGASGRAAKANGKVDTSSAPLLDTFDSTRSADAVNLAARPPGPSQPIASTATGPKANGSIMTESLPSEEEQMAMVREMDGWEEVPSKAQKKKQKKPAATADEDVTETPVAAPVENKHASVSTAELVNGGRNGNTASKKQGNNKNLNGFAALEAEGDDDSGLVDSRSSKGHPLDSDWAV